MRSAFTVTQDWAMGVSSAALSPSPLMSLVKYTLYTHKGFEFHCLKVAKCNVKPAPETVYAESSIILSRRVK